MKLKHWDGSALFWDTKAYYLFSNHAPIAMSYLEPEHNDTIENLVKENENVKLKLKKVEEKLNMGFVNLKNIAGRCMWKRNVRILNVKWKLVTWDIQKFAVISETITSVNFENIAVWNIFNLNIMILLQI